MRRFFKKYPYFLDETQVQCSTSEDQSTIESFFNESTILKSYKCPICETNVQARNETAFNSKHFENCLVSSESQDFLGTTTNTGVFTSYNFRQIMFDGHKNFKTFHD